MTRVPNGPDPLLLEHMTWPEVELALTRGMTTVVIPVGAVEQHGPHLPLFVDAERGGALGRRVARALGDALVAPTIRVGCSEHHMGFAGTISIRPSTLEALCRDYCTSLARHGFREIYLVPSHGGNFQVLEQMVPRLQEAVDEIDPDCRVVAYTDLLGIIAVWRWVAEEEVGLGRHVGGHADIAESSEMLHLHPDLVRVERAEKGSVGELDQAAVDRIFEKGLRAIAPNGILGDARGMDGQLGERMLDAVARVVVHAFREEGIELPSGEGAERRAEGHAESRAASGGAGATDEPSADEPVVRDEPLEDALDDAEFEHGAGFEEDLLEDEEEEEGGYVSHGYLDDPEDYDGDEDDEEEGFDPYEEALRESGDGGEGPSEDDEPH